MSNFSVIMPLYNKAPYVRKAVESVVKQTCRDWELIVVDDGSTDGGGDIVASIADPRIRLVQQENAGVSVARNRGVALSEGSLLCFLDADDWWEPTFLEEMAGLVERHPGAGIYGTSYWIIKNGRKRLAPIGVEEGFAEGEINYCHVYAQTLCMPLTSITVCIPRMVFDEAGGFPLGITLGEDFLLWLRIALKHKTVLLNNPLANYNQDVDITYRGTHHLHPPERHMLWHMGEYEPLERSDPDYKQLIDNLRTYSLQKYYLNSKYRGAARQELSKVDWGKQNDKLKRIYNLPVGVLKIYYKLWELGSALKRVLTGVICKSRYEESSN